MSSRTLYLSRKEFGMLVTLLAILFSIPLLAPLLYRAGQATSVWPSYYIGGAMVAHGFGSRLYDVAQQQTLWASLEPQNKEILPYIAPPYVAILLALDALLPYTASAWLWALFNLALVLLILFYLNQELLRCPTVPRFWIDLGVILFVPTLTVVFVQQTSFPLVLAVLMSWRCFKARRDFAAGMWLSLWFLKPHLIWAPVLVFVYKKKFRALAPLLLGGGFLALVSFLLIGGDGLKDWLDLLARQSGWNYNPEIRWPAMTTSWAGFVQLLFVSKTIALPLLAQILWLLGVGAAVYLLLKAWQGPWEVQSPRFDLQWGLLLATTVFTTLHGYAYELVLLVPPFAMIFAAQFDSKNAAGRRLRRAIVSAWILAPFGILLAFLTGFSFLPLLLGAGICWLAWSGVRKENTLEVNL